MPGPDEAADGYVLVCAPFGHDAESVVELLKQAGYPADACPDLASLAGRFDAGAGALLITEEALTSGCRELEAALGRQPAWSDVPLLFLSAARSRTASWSTLTAARYALPATATNVVVLERPLGVAPLVSAVASAVRARERQYEIRDSLEAQRRAAEELEVQVKERTRDLEQALERLKGEVDERERAEEQLRQAQKMEAVGQLTGGIAHDFNNMLTGVMGSLDIIKRRIASDRLDDIDRFMEAASTSAQRAATLTQRLLAFSRRQSLDARTLDVNALVQSLEELMRRTIGENIVLRTTLSDAAAFAVADANQLESAILNLAINARDAMPEGGVLTVETKVVELPPDVSVTDPAGRFVMISIVDTGVGMSPETISRVFDPFFTTKPIGQGTGLGLSMVYGFAKQSGGHVKITSRPGEGTRVSLYLPATEQDAHEAAPNARAEHIPNGRGERVLIVEDEHAVRQLLREALGELGYETEEAVDAQTALSKFASGAQFDMMISDVGLPGTNGRQLAEEVRRSRPDLPILFVTGYAANAGVRGEFLGSNMSMITKPFTLDTVAAKVRQMLAGAADR